MNTILRILDDEIFALSAGSPSVPTLAQQDGITRLSSKQEEATKRARARRRAKAQMMKRLDVKLDSGTVTHDPLFQRAVAALLINGYTPGDISRASRGQISENQVLSTLRSLLLAEVKEIAPLARASRSWPRARRIYGK